MLHPALPHSKAKRCIKEVRMNECSTTCSFVRFVQKWADLDSEAKIRKCCEAWPPRLDSVVRFYFEAQIFQVQKTSPTQSQSNMILSWMPYELNHGHVSLICRIWNIMWVPLATLAFQNVFVYRGPEHSQSPGPCGLPDLPGPNHPAELQKALWSHAEGDVLERKSLPLAYAKLLWCVASTSSWGKTQGTKWKLLLHLLLTQLAIGSTSIVSWPFIHIARRCGQPS